MTARYEGVSRPFCVVVLAAGAGTRMRSAQPKVLHQLCGRAMVHYVLDAVNHEDAQSTLVVIGPHATEIEKELGERSAAGSLHFAVQSEPLGTGHAVAAAIVNLDALVGEGDSDVLIVPGDAPLLRRESVADLVSRHRSSRAALTVLSATLEDPSGYGRLVRARDSTLERIREESGASPEERAIREVNTSVMVVRQSLLGPGLRRVGRYNAQGEYYLTDLVAVLHDMGHPTRAVALEDAREAFGVNDRRQLAYAESVLRARINATWMERGVTMRDPASTYLDADVELAPDVILWPGTTLRGRCVVGGGSEIGPNADLEDVVVGRGVHLGAVRARGARFGDGASVGSFVTIERGAVIDAGVRVAR